jgi:hypothetical protein
VEVRKSLALAIAVSGVAQSALAADPGGSDGSWSGPYIGISGGGGWGEGGQHSGILLLPSRAGSSGTGGTSGTTTIIPRASGDGRYR